MNRKSLSRIAGLAVVFFFLGFAAFAAGNTVLEFWSWNNEGSYPVVHADAQARFEKDHPGVTVKRDYISYAEYMVKLKAVLSGEEAPDVFQIPWAGEYPELAYTGRVYRTTNGLQLKEGIFIPSQ